MFFIRGSVCFLAPLCYRLSTPGAFINGITITNRHEFKEAVCQPCVELLQNIKISRCKLCAALDCSHFYEAVQSDSTRSQASHPAAAKVKLRSLHSSFNVDNNFD